MTNNQVSFKGIKQHREKMACELTAAMYISRDENMIIVAPHYQANFPLEQESVLLIPFEFKSSEIGDKLLEAFLMFERKEPGFTGDWEWAALNASRLDVNKFDRKYKYFRFSTSQTSTNIYIEIRGFPNKNWNRELCIESTIGLSSNMAVAKESIGNRVLNVYKACEQLDKGRY